MKAPTAFAKEHGPPNRRSAFSSESRLVLTCLRIELAMSICLAVGGKLLHSQALLAEAYHAFGDFGSALIAAACVRLASTSRSKIASLASFALNAALVAAASSKGASALSSLLRTPEPAIHGAGATAAGVAVLCIVAKAYLYRATAAVARENKSAVLEAYAMHHLLDSATSVVALAVTGCQAWIGAEYGLDQLGSLVISAAVLGSSCKGLFGASKELVDGVSGP